MPPSIQATCTRVASTRARRHFGSVGLFGLGAFGRLIAQHLAPHVPIIAHDPAVPGDVGAAALGEPREIAVRSAQHGSASRVRIGSLAETAGCDLVILAVPVAAMPKVLADIRPHLTPGAMVIDVGSVKVLPVRLMQELLPPTVDCAGTHPLFGPQSARGGLRGRKIAVCPVRGDVGRISAFLRRTLGLDVILTTPEAHDREAALVQGLTHLIARVLVRMEPWPARLTTASFDHLRAAAEMVRYDAASVYEAIERDNPFAAAVRERFFRLAAEAQAELDGTQ